MPPTWLVVIGASAGGHRPLLDLAARLPADFPAALCVVVHIPPHSPSHLPELLNRAGPLPAQHAQPHQPLRPGHIYCAPPDHHLLVDDGHLSLAKGPRENRSRPAIDPLFRSAAYRHGPAVIGLLLSGLLDDGTSGLWTIKRFGGTVIVQDPAEAEFPAMPQSALQQVAVDEATRERLEVEVQVAQHDHAFGRGVMGFGKVTPQTCPECGGVLVQILEDGFTRYRCHTGHA